MTHIENIPHIIKYGITHVNSGNRNTEYVSIGDSGLITNRDNFVIPNKNKLGDYIPFYFGVRMPMLFVIQRGFNRVKETKAENIVYCITSVFKILEHKLEFVYTNGHGIDELTDFFDAEAVENILDDIDKSAIEKKYWNDETDLDLKRRKEAEFLVKNDIPVDAILGYAVFNDTAKQKLITLGIKDEQVVIKPGYYF